MMVDDITLIMTDGQPLFLLKMCNGGESANVHVGSQVVNCSGCW